MRWPGCRRVCICWPTLQMLDEGYNIFVVEDACGAANGVVLADLRAVLDRHIPAAEIDDAGAQLVVKIVKRSASTHIWTSRSQRACGQARANKKGRQAHTLNATHVPAAPLSCDLRDQA